MPSDLQMKAMNAIHRAMLKASDDKPPARLLNLQASSAVRVSVGGKPAAPWTAQVASPQERARLWPLLTAKHTNYASYQRKTDREIPLVLLRPAP